MIFVITVNKLKDFISTISLLISENSQIDINKLSKGIETSCFNSILDYINKINVHDYTILLYHDEIDDIILNFNSSQIMIKHIIDKKINLDQVGYMTPQELT